MKVSVVIPVLHEGGTINGSLAALREAQPGGPSEVIVVDGSPGADTLLRITDCAVMGIVCERGRARQMNRGAAQARGDVLLFLHADTRLPRLFEEAVCGSLRGGCVAGAFDLAIDGDSPAFRIIERAASLRSRLTRIPYGDQAIFVRRGYFFDMGGYREMPLMEDVDLMRRIRDRGDRIRIIRQKALTSGRRWLSEGLFRCTLRNRAVMLLYLAGVPPATLARWYGYPSSPPPRLPPEER